MITDARTSAHKKLEQISYRRKSFGVNQSRRHRQPMDRKDFTLLKFLQHDASQRLEDLARPVNLAVSSVHERLQRLQRDGTIRRWTIEVDPAAAGLHVLAFV